jgi:FMN phosphatase YigB (HAD superfamily)
MTTKTELILDIAGVLATNLSPLFWHDLSLKSGIPNDDLVKYKKNIREELWTGKITEGEFWTQLCEQFPSIDIDNARLMLHSNIKPLPAIEEVPIWSQFANIHLLSNHRIEWIGPTLNPIQDYVKSITISSQVGCCKPQSDIYTIVKSRLNTETNILFIDDQEKNFKEAKKLGWNTLLADGKGEWIKKVIPLLNLK